VSRLGIGKNPEKSIGSKCGLGGVVGGGEVRVVVGDGLKSGMGSGGYGGHEDGKRWEGRGGGGGICSRVGKIERRRSER